MGPISSSLAKSRRVSTENFFDRYDLGFRCRYASRAFPKALRGASETTGGRLCPVREDKWDILVGVASGRGEQSCNAVSVATGPDVGGL